MNETKNNIAKEMHTRAFYITSNSINIFYSTIKKAVYDDIKKNIYMRG